jgi:hypothetical protein
MYHHAKPKCSDLNSGCISTHVDHFLCYSNSFLILRTQILNIFVVLGIMHASCMLTTCSTNRTVPPVPLKFWLKTVKMPYFL